MNERKKLTIYMQIKLKIQNKNWILRYVNMYIIVEFCEQWNVSIHPAMANCGVRAPVIEQFPRSMEACRFWGMYLQYLESSTAFCLAILLRFSAGNLRNYLFMNEWMQNSKSTIWMTDDDLFLNDVL